jgi:hypothetical protein
MNYLWQGEKYEYPDIIIYLGPGDTSSRDFRIRGKTARCNLHSLFGPPSRIKAGIVRKSFEAELAILQKHKAAWEKADRIEVTKFWMEKIKKNDGTYPDWDWVQRESKPLVLSDSDRAKVLCALTALNIPERSDLDAITSKPYTIKIYRQDQLLDTLSLSNFNGIIGIPGINTALRFEHNSHKCLNLLCGLFPAE